MKLEQVVSDISLACQKGLDQNAAPKIGRHQAYTSVSTENIHHRIEGLTPNEQQRVLQEFSGLGPLTEIFRRTDLLEVIIGGKDNLWIETREGFEKCPDVFLSDLTYTNFIHRVCEEAGVQTNFRHPFANGFWRGFRLHMASPPVVPHHLLTLRRLSTEEKDLEFLFAQGWCTSQELSQLEKLVRDRQNLIVVGNTGSGKTTLLNALIQKTGRERSVFIEDTPELIVANSLSAKLLTRFDCQGVLPEITATELVKQSLRMRPDRLIIGEVRGEEAKDLLQALATGHRGSMTSLHAHSPHEALLRLEMLVQMGAPQWNLEAIRRLIQLTVDRLIVTRREGKRWYLEGVYVIASQEKFGFIVEREESLSVPGPVSGHTGSSR